MEITGQLITHKSLKGLKSMSNTLKIQDSENVYFKIYIMLLMESSLDELVTLKEAYSHFDDAFVEELKIISYVINFRKTALGAALC